LFETPLGVEPKIGHGLGVVKKKNSQKKAPTIVAEGPLFFIFYLSF